MQNHSIVFFTDLFVVVRVVAVAVSIQQSVLLPYLTVTAVAGTDAAQQLLQFGPESFCRHPLPVRQVFDNRSHQNL